MLRKIESKDMIYPKGYGFFDTERVELGTFKKINVIQERLKNIVKNDAVIQTIMIEDDFYKRNFGIDSTFSKLKDGFDGYSVEDLVYLYNKVMFGYVKSESLTHLQLEDGLTDIGKEVLYKMLKNNEIDEFLVNLYSGKYMEDIKDKCDFEYISETEEEIKIDFVDRLFSDRGFRYQGSFCVSSKTIEELNYSDMMEAIKRHVEHLYLSIDPVSYDDVKTYYIKWLWWF